MEDKENMEEKNIMRNEGININFIKLKPNKQIPFHNHKKTKYNYIIKGSMSTEKGEFKEGDLIMNEKDSSHLIKAGKDGCEFLVIWSE